LVVNIKQHKSHLKNSNFTITQSAKFFWHSNGHVDDDVTWSQNIKKTVMETPISVGVCAIKS